MSKTPRKTKHRTYLKLFLLVLLRALGSLDLLLNLGLLVLERSKKLGKEGGALGPILLLLLLGLTLSLQ